MNWLRRLFARGRSLPPDQALALAAHRARRKITGAEPLATLRWVVVDVETSGLNPNTDRLLSIGAVEIINGRIRLNSGFEVILRQPQASTSANILIHRIDGTTQLSGLEPARAMLDFLEYAGCSPLAGFHAGFDRAMIRRAGMEMLGYAPSNPWLDLAYLASALLADASDTVPQGLDGWLDRHDIKNCARHDAMADALATAQLLQIVLARAQARGIATLRDLIRIEQAERWLALA